MNEKTDRNQSFLTEDEDETFEAVEAPAEVAAPQVPDNEAQKRADHDAAEAKRKANFDARQARKRQEREAQIARVQAMTGEEVIAAAMGRVSADTEKLTRRNMKELVAEHIQTLCLEDEAFARLTMDPRKRMVRCFQYINRKAFEYVQDEMKASGIRPGPGMQTYGTDIPDEVCYQWAEDYFRDPTVKEDQEEEEQFVPKPYAGSTPAKPRQKKTTPKKPEAKKQDQKQPQDQESFGQMAFG